jgi:lipid-A-disaccharide synthase
MGNRPVRLRTVISLLMLLASAATIFFITYQMAIGTGEVLWIRPLGAKRSAPIWLHTIGCIGIGAFSFRFWLQWWEAERKAKSLLSEKFWWISLFGGFVAAFYFYKTKDFVNIVGPLFALIPYVRNLMLLKKEKVVPCDIAIISGESSGDLLGKQIADELLLSKSNLSLCGVAGPAMREAGVTPWMRTESFQVMGIVDVIKKLPFLTYSVHRLVRTIVRSNPKAVILIDQPSFSLAIAKRLKKKGFSGKIIQAVAPTVWAYKPERVDSFATYFDLILPLYRFEKELFSEKLPTVWIGHPIVHELKKVETAKEKNTLALFPGSRPAEIRRNLSLQLNAAAAIVKDHPDLCIAISAGKMLSPAMRHYIKSLANKTLSQNVELVEFSDRYELMSRSKAAIAKLGTITLELALFNVPLVCCYKIGRFTEWWARRFLRLTPRDFALPNILYGKTVIPECVIPPVVAQDLHREITPYLVGKKSFPKNFKESLIKQIDPQLESEGLIAQAILESL